MWNMVKCSCYEWNNLSLELELLEHKISSYFLLKLWVSTLDKRKLALETRPKILGHILCFFSAIFKFSEMLNFVFLLSEMSGRKIKNVLQYSHFWAVLFIRIGTGSIHIFPFTCAVSSSYCYKSECPGWFSGLLICLLVVFFLISRFNFGNLGFWFPWSLVLLAVAAALFTYIALLLVRPPIKPQPTFLFSVP